VSRLEVVTKSSPVSYQIDTSVYDICMCVGVCIAYIPIPIVLE